MRTAILDECPKCGLLEETNEQLCCLECRLLYECMQGGGVCQYLTTDPMCKYAYEYMEGKKDE